MIRYVLTGICIALWIVVSGQVHFTNVAGQVGVNVSYGSGAPGGGLSFCDFDRDGWDDLTMSSEWGEKLHFYRNTGGQFEEIEPLVNHSEQSKQVIWVDFDNDGDKDLYVATFDGPNRLYRNDGSLEMTEITTMAGLPVDEYRTFGACWGDYNRDGWLDLYYSERKQGQGTTQNRMFRNNADGTFTDVSSETNTADEGKIPFCSAFIDINNDKWPDIYTANDKRSINTMLLNNGDGTFTDVSAETMTDLAMDAMCVTAGDYNNDGWLDIYVTNTPEGNVLLQNNSSDTTGPIAFADVTEGSGTAFNGIGWGSNFLDADNDGDLDLYVSGMALGQDPVTSEFYLNEGTGQFLKGIAGFIGDSALSFSNAIGDLDNDGFPDIAVINQAPFDNHIWRNGGGDENWLKIDLQGVLSNRDGIGTRIEIFAGDTYQLRYTHCGSGFLAQNSSTEIIGLGTYTIIDSILVTWPTGHIDRLYEINTGQRLAIVEGMTTGGSIHVDDDIQIISSTRQPLPAAGKVDIYPTPANSKIDIAWEAFDVEAIVIVTSTGSVFARYDTHGEQVSIDISTWPSGLYLVLLEYAGAVRAVGRCVKT